MKVVFVIAKEGFRDEEYEIPKRMLEKEEITVVTASSERGECVGMLGKRVKAELSIDEINPNDFDAIVLVGGVGCVVYQKDEKLHSILREFEKQGKVIAAICLAPTILANAGLLKGKHATVWPDAARQIEEKGAIYEDKDCVIDGKILTAPGPHAAKKFGEALIKLLKG